VIKGIAIGFILAIAISAGCFIAFSRAWRRSQRPIHLCRLRNSSRIWPWTRISRSNTFPHPPCLWTNRIFSAGASVYKQHCAVCHGLPGQPPVDYLTTMFPIPPQLFRGKGVSDDPASETYWKAANGVRLSGMPSFKTKLTDTQLWQVSELLAPANEIPDSVKRVLTPDSPTAASSPAQTSVSGQESAK